MNAKNKAQRLAKANAKPCDNADVGFRLSLKGCVQTHFYSVKVLGDRIAIIQQAFSCINGLEHQRLVSIS